ncbi:hypothetical protein WA556_002857 [Blastocystis sp. ATCC 50177/Nand II]
MCVSWLAVFCLLLHTTLSTSLSSLNLCSREGSMEVQRLIEKHVSPVVEYYEYVLPNTCPLKIENSRFYLENQFKERLEEGHYRCGKCGKVFVHEYYLLLHNERKHPELQSTSTVCLAKYRSVFDGVTGKKPNCYDVETKRSLIMCQKTMMLCFPTEDYAVQSDLYKYMYRSLCAPLLCQTTVEERTEEYTPVTVTAVVFPVVIVIVAFAILFIVMYKKFSTPKEDLRIFSKFD